MAAFTAKGIAASALSICFLATDRSSMCDRWHLSYQADGSFSKIRCTVEAGSIELRAQTVSFYRWRRRRRLVQSVTRMIVRTHLLDHSSVRPPAGRGRGRPPPVRPTCQQIGTVVRGKGRSHHTIPFPFDYPQLLNCKRILHAAFSIGHTFSDDGNRERMEGRE